MHNDYHPDVKVALDHFHPLYDFCLIERIMDAEVAHGVARPSHIVNPLRSASGREPFKGVVRSTGPGDKRHDEDGRHAMNVQVGDIVFYTRREANMIRINNVEMSLHHEEQDILAVLEELAPRAWNDDGSGCPFDEI